VARLALLGLTFLLAGCGPGGVRYPETGATLEGTVTFGNDPVTAALVVAQNKDGSATGFVGKDGRYRLQNVPLGEIHLAVNTEAGKGQAMGEIMAASQGKDRAAPKIIDVPAKFADPDKSGITTTISKGVNTYNIVIPR
jgi:hypothetical protein